MFEQISHSAGKHRMSLLYSKLNIKKLQRCMNLTFLLSMLSIMLPAGQLSQKKKKKKMIQQNIEITAICHW